MRSLLHRVFRLEFVTRFRCSLRPSLGVLRRQIHVWWLRTVPHTGHMSRQPKYLLPAKSAGRRLVHQSRCVVVHFQHLSHESRGEATVGLLRFLFITTFFLLGFCAAGFTVSFLLFSSNVGYPAAWRKRETSFALRRRSWIFLYKRLYSLVFLFSGQCDRIGLAIPRVGYSLVSNFSVFG